MEEVGPARIVEDLWDSRRAFQIPGPAGTAIFPRNGMISVGQHPVHTRIKNRKLCDPPEKVLTLLFGWPFSSPAKGAVLPGSQTHQEERIGGQFQKQRPGLEL